MKWTKWTLWTEWTATRDRGRSYFILHLSSFILAVFILFFLFTSSATGAEVFLTEPQATLTHGTSETVWISDIEHVAWKPTGEVFLADSTHPVLMARDRIPAGNRFQLFPYHFISREETDLLGGVPRYRLAARNDTSAPLTLAITGMGAVTDWNHDHAWDGALRGDGATTITLAPGAEHTIWQTAALRPDYPWSAVVLGTATGDLTVYDYCHLNEQDPLARNPDNHADSDQAAVTSAATPRPNAHPRTSHPFAPPGPSSSFILHPSSLPLMPDLAWPPHLLASFTRGTADWFTGDIRLFPDSRDARGDIPLSRLAGKVTSVAFGYSPGGPITDLCEYKQVQPSFAADTLTVKDPASGWSHVFFGGNYPVMYRLPLHLANDTTAPLRVELWLCSNDRFGVDTVAGVWLDGCLTRSRVPAIVKGRRWRAHALTLAPGERAAVEPLIVALGGRWGGIVASLTATPADAPSPVPPALPGDTRD